MSRSVAVLFSFHISLVFLLLHPLIILSRSYNNDPKMPLTYERTSQSFLKQSHALKNNKNVSENRKLLNSMFGIQHR